jgi:acetyl esterase/lipase
MKPKIKQVHIGLPSRIRVLLLRLFFKPVISRMTTKSSLARIASIQARAAGVFKDSCCGLPVEYRVINNAPGSMVGDPRPTNRLALLYLHGGAFMYPASPQLQLTLLAQLCVELDAVGFMPDYRLTPQHPAPAALDDCERAYRGLLSLGYSPSQIVLLGESAGGNLVLCLLQRIRKGGLAMPACAIPMSAVTDMARVHAPPARVLNAKREALVSLSSMQRINDWYVGHQDATDPEISPLYADYTGFPPLYFLASDSELLRDDTVLVAERAKTAGVPTRLDVWPILPHAFPIFGHLFVEVQQARADILGFIRQQTRRITDPGDYKHC